MVNARGLWGRSRTHGIPPMRCTATAKGTGEQCQKFAMVGMTVCNMHGVTGNGRRKAEERVTLAQLLQQDRRHPWEVVLEATHTMDAIVRDLQLGVLAGETITINQVRHHMAKTAIDTKAHENVAMAFTRHLELEGQLVASAVGVALDKLGLTEPWRVYALLVANRALLGESGDAQGDEPQPPTDPVVMEYDVRPSSNAPAIEAASKPCDVAKLNDDALRSLGEQILVELERRDLNG
jgi:hypothetical protein